MDYKLLPRPAPQVCSLEEIAGAFSQLITDKQRGFFTTRLWSATLHGPELAKLVDKITAIFAIATVGMAPGAVVIVKT